MIVKTLLYVVYFVKLSEEIPLNAEMPDIYDFAANVLQDVTTKRIDSNNFHKSTFTSNQRPEIDTSSRSVQKFKKHNAYKNQKGYTFSEVFHDGVKDGTTSKSIVDVIPESRFLYHSFKNPLFKSNSLNLQTENDEGASIIGDVHKISSPFESKWIFFPRNNGFDKGLGSSFEFFNKNRGIRNPTDSIFTSQPVKLSNNTIFGDSTQLTSLADKPSPVNAIDTTSTEKSFYGYNLEEVKTSDGKTHGIMQIFDKDGLKRNVVYDEKGVIDQTAKGNTSQPAVNATATTKVKNNALNVTKLQKVNNNSTAQLATSTPSSYLNDKFNFSANTLPSEEVEYNPPIMTSFATPEYILFNFLGQLSSMPFVPSNENFISNELSSFDESVDENSFFFVE